MRKILILVFMVLICGCDGFGIAGAGYDSKQSLKEVENYKAYIAPAISEEIIQNKNGVTYHSEDILRSFSFSIPKLDGNSVAIPQYGLSAIFQNRELVVKNKDQIIINEQLPSVFYMHPMRLGIDEIGGAPVLMVINNSRATTGMRFIGIYKLDGTVLYKNVLSKEFAHDISKAKDHIDIIGCDVIHRITLKK